MDFYIYFHAASDGMNRPSVSQKYGTVLEYINKLQIEFLTICSISFCFFPGLDQKKNVWKKCSQCLNC